MKLTKKTVYIGLFAILYLIVAFSSFFHACAFFGLANNSWMSVILAFAFEVGQAAVLFSLLTSTKDRGRVMPWVLMFMFTLVQVIGNVYSSYKYIITNSVENLRYFKEPIFIWTDLPDNQANVIIVYLVGALLPIAALLLTSMITNYLTDQEEEKKEQIEEQKDEEIVEEPIKEEIKEENEQSIEFTEEKSDNDNGEQSINTIENQAETEIQNNEIKNEENNQEKFNDEIESKESNNDDKSDKQNGEDINRPSHFINL